MECPQVGDKLPITIKHPFLDISALSFNKTILNLIPSSYKGLVTTTQVTHASPAGVYAHTANRNWESNKNLQDDGADPEVCTDIAKQLVNGQVGKKLKVSKMKQHNDNKEHEKRG